ncbi:MAG TPA: DNA polymerase I, partial [Vicinamibacteria bacterium]|nr:DNA polymerase I [Vicinamibacteria bacterium]
IPPLATRAGFPTNAVLGFVNVVRKVLTDERHDFAAVTFDAGGRTFRHERFQAYKANRPPTPDTLKQQTPYTRRVCAVLGLPILETPGIEADDIIGTLSRQAVEKGFRVLIVSSDKDLLQLVSGDVTVIHPVKYDRLDPEGVRTKFGVPPERVADVLALMGDSIDNIPGVPGIGEKGASNLINEYGSLESLLDRAGEVRNKRQREALEQHGEGARLSKELVTIATHLDLDVAFEELEYRGPDREAARRLFEELEFTSIVKDYMPPREETADLSASFHPLETAAELDRFLALARVKKKLSFWLDLTEPERGSGFDPWGRRLRAVGLAVEPGEAFFAVSGGNLDESGLIERLAPVLADASVSKVGHSLKLAMTFFGARGLSFSGAAFDTELASYVLNPSRRSQALADLVLEFLQKPLSEESEPAGAQGVLPGMAPPSETAASRGRLAAERAERILRLSERMAIRLAEDELERVHGEIELPLIEVLAAMELAGIAIERAEFERMSIELEAELQRLTLEIYELAGMEFNINSPRQLGEILFDKMNLPSFKKTEKQRAASTRVDVLEELASAFPLPKKVLEYRSLSKLKGTYIDVLPSLVQPRTGRLHTTFHQTVAATGRLSSSDPNLQNIPIRSDLARRLRRAFVAAPGKKLLSADYSQIELRVLAHLSQDPTLIEAFRAGEDIHDRTARQVFGDSALSAPEKRRRAKIINFSIIYGKTAFTLGKEFGVPTREAQAFIDAYLDRYPRVRELIDEIIRETRRTGKVRTLFGRQRYVPEIGSRNRATRSAAERVAVNTPIQGTAADLIKKAMIDLYARLRREELETRLLLQVHDELVLESPDREVERASRVVLETMENVHPLLVPLRVDLKIGASWEH